MRWRSLSKAGAQLIMGVSMLLELSSVAVAMNGNSMTPEILASHIGALYAGHSGGVTKWALPIRYKVFGELSQHQFDDFHEVMGQIRAITRHDISVSDAANNQRPNAVFIFLYNVDPVLTDPAVIKLFSKTNELEVDFLKRMRANFARGLVSGHGFNDEGITVNAQILNLSRYQYEKIRYFMAFSCMTVVGSSDVIQPSVTNSANKSENLEEVDKALLTALYRHEIRFEEPLAEATPKLIQYMRGSLSTQQ